MARIVHVRVDSTMGSISPPSSAGGSVDLDLGDDQFLNLQSFDLSIAFQILKKASDDVDTLFRPPTLSESEFLGLGSSAHMSIVPHERHTSLMVQDIFQVLLSFLEVH